MRQLYIFCLFLLDAVYFIYTEATKPARCALMYSRIRQAGLTVLWKRARFISQCENRDSLFAYSRDPKTTNNEMKLLFPLQNFES